IIHTSCRNRKWRCEALSPSQVHGSTTKSSGMWKFSRQPIHFGVSLFLSAVFTDFGVEPLGHFHPCHRYLARIGDVVTPCLPQRTCSEVLQLPDFECLYPFGEGTC